MLAHHVDDTAFVLEGGIDNRLAVGPHFQPPRLFVIRARNRIIAAEKTIVESKVLAHHKGGMGVLFNVVLEVQLVFQNVVYHTTQEGNIRT